MALKLTDIDYAEPNRACSETRLQTAPLLAGRITGVITLLRPERQHRSVTLRKTSRIRLRPQVGYVMTTIVIAEDTDDVREVLQRLFSRAGFDVLTAPDGRAALDAAASIIPMWFSPI